MDLCGELADLFNLPYEEQEQFLAHLDVIHSAAYSKKIDRSHEKEFEGIDEFIKSGEIPPAFLLTLKDVPLHCLFAKGEAKRLYVIFNGSRDIPKPPAKYRMNAPRFSYSHMFAGNFLFIDDPMFYIYPKINLGWYYGYRDLPFLLVIDVFIMILINKLGVEASRVTFFSSSGGGYAALVAACYFPNSLSVSINPQLTLHDFRSYKNFKENTGLDLQEEDKFLRNDMAALIHKSQSHHVIIVNSKDNVDMTQQLLPVCQKLDIQPKYGVTVKNNLVVWLYNAEGVPSTHTSFETRPLFLAIMHIASMFKAGMDVGCLHPLILLLNEIWWERYNYLKEMPPKNEASDIIFLMPNSLNNFTCEKEYTNISLNKRDHTHNHRRLFKIKPNLFYFVEMTFNTDLSPKQFSYGLFDFARNRIINMNNRYAKGKIDYSFISGKNVDCEFIFYADIIGQTVNKSITINKIRILSRSICP